MADKKILYYLNQFFGQIGGEEKAGIAPILKEDRRLSRACSNSYMWR